MQSANTIWIDRDGAGHGWFLDGSTGSDGSYFPTAVGDTLEARTDSLAFGRIDLLTVIEHEIGHWLGYAHGNRQGVMDEILKPGTRRIPAQVIPGREESAASFAENLLSLTATTAPALDPDAVDWLLEIS